MPQWRANNIITNYNSNDAEAKGVGTAGAMGRWPMQCRNRWGTSVV